MKEFVCQSNEIWYLGYLLINHGTSHDNTNYQRIQGPINLIQRQSIPKGFTDAEIQQLKFLYLYKQRVKKSQDFLELNREWVSIIIYPQSILCQKCSECRDYHSVVREWMVTRPTDFIEAGMKITFQRPQTISFWA